MWLRIKASWCLPRFWYQARRSKTVAVAGGWSEWESFSIGFGTFGIISFVTASYDLYKNSLMRSWRSERRRTKRPSFRLREACDASYAVVDNWQKQSATSWLTVANSVDNWLNSSSDKEIAISEWLVRYNMRELIFINTTKLQELQHKNDLLSAQKKYALIQKCFWCFYRTKSHRHSPQLLSQGSES